MQKENDTNIPMTMIPDLINNQYKRPYLFELIRLLNNTKKLEDFRYFDKFIHEHNERLK